MAKIKAFTPEELPALFNEWMRRFTEEPESFQAEFKSVGLFLAEQAAGREPSYGEHCLAFLDKLRAGMNAPPTVMIAATPEVLAMLSEPVKKSRRAKR